MNSKSSLKDRTPNTDNWVSRREGEGEGEGEGVYYVCFVGSQIQAGVAFLV